MFFAIRPTRRKAPKRNSEKRGRGGVSLWLLACSLPSALRVTTAASGGGFSVLACSLPSAARGVARGHVPCHSLYATWTVSCRRPAFAVRRTRPGTFGCRRGGLSVLACSLPSAVRSVAGGHVLCHSPHATRNICYRNIRNVNRHGRPFGLHAVTDQSKAKS